MARYATRALFGSRSAEVVQPAYVVNTLTILHEANGSVSVRLVSYHGPDEENQHASAYATTSRGHVVKKLHF